MKRLNSLFLLLAALFTLSACYDENPGTTLSNATPSRSTVVEDCAKGHAFPNNADICSGCGVDYYATTLEFTLNATKDGYIVSGIGSCTRTAITIPNTYKGLPVTEIGESAFMDCAALDVMILPDSLIKIGQCAFQFCSALQEIVIPPNVTSIGAYAFSCCDSLEKLELHDGIVHVGEGLVMSSNALEFLYIPAPITQIPQFFAQYCKSLKVVECGGNIKNIGTASFSYCVSLESFDFGNTLESISPVAFEGCSSLAAVKLPDTVKTVDTCAFRGCTGLRQLTIPSTVETIGIRITQRCDALEYNIYKGMQYLGNEENPYLCFMGRADDTEKDVIIHDDTRFVWPNVSFVELEAEVIYWGKSVESYWFEAFYERDTRKGCSALSKIEVSPENKKYQAKGNCLIETATKTLLHGCKTSMIPDDGSVTIIGKNAFWGLETLTCLVIPNTVEKIGGNTFLNCRNLEWLVIGIGVKRIEHDILMDANPSVKVFYMGSAADWEKMEIIGYNCFDAIGGNYELKNAPRYYYSETQPTEEGNFWHYVDGKPTPWKTEE